MATAVYVLCALTSVLCAALLVRGYRRSRARFLLWASLCFVLLAVNNVLLFVDLALWTSTSLADLRTISGFAGLAVLLYGLIWETR